MKQYTLKDPKPLGDKDSKYGQTYWSYSHDSDFPVMFNLMEGEVHDGSVITAETVELKTSNKGTDYHRLKKVKISGQLTPPNATAGNPTPRFTPPAITPNDSSKMLRLIYDNTEKILGLVQSPQNGTPSLKDEWDKVAPKDAEPDNIIEDIGDEPMNLEDIPF
jgi:hypothetical protein